MKNIMVTKSSMPSFEEYCNEIKDLWETHWLTNKGKKHCLLEKELITYLDVNNLSLFVNGHLALEAALALYRFPAGSEIITTPFTFVSTTNAIVRNNLVPVFCDINLDDFTIDVDKIESLISRKTVAILPVHVYGHVCNIDAIDKIAKRHHLKVIYDSAHAFGVKYKGKGVGNYGDLSMFSFHATKVFNTIEGGCLTFNNSDYKQDLEDSKNFGIRDEEHCLYVGGNAKMNEFQAAMGLCNLRHIDAWIEHRKQLVNLYKQKLGCVDGIKICDEQLNVESNYSYMPILFDGKKYLRDEVQNALSKYGIGSRKYFYPLTSDLDCYSDFNSGFTPNARYVSSHILTLPLSTEIAPEDVEMICDIILGKDGK